MNPHYSITPLLHYSITSDSQLIQSHQKRRSMLSSSRSHKNSISEKPYRVGQLLAAPPSRAAQVFSSFLKNCARCDRTFSVSGSFSSWPNCCSRPAPGWLACPDRHPENRGWNAAVQSDFFAGRQRNRRETGLDEHNVSIARRLRSVRTQEQPSTEQIPINFLDIGHVERFDLMVMHLHGQVRHTRSTGSRARKITFNFGKYPTIRRMILLVSVE